MNVEDNQAYWSQFLIDADIPPSKVDACAVCNDLVDEIRVVEQWCETLSERLENIHGCVAFLLAVVTVLALLR